MAGGPSRRWLIPLIALVAPLPATAQYNTGEIAGIVRDAQGGVLPGALVVAEHTATGHRVERVTSPEGRFLLPGLQVGEYRITVELAGFKRHVRPGIVVNVGETLELTVVLELGGVTETVTVAAELPLLETARAEVAHVVVNEQVVKLPLAGRQFMQLALLTDNVVIPPGGTRGAALQQAGTLFNVAGQRSGHNIYLLDGVKVTDEYFNNMVVSLSPEAIQEFKITKSQYPAEFGGKAAALVNVVTRSGTNRVRGSLVDFFRHSALDAHNFFDDKTKPVPPLRQNLGGGSVGGPIRRERTFFFVNYEGQRSRRSITQTFSVPPEPLRQGDVRGLGPLCDPLSDGPAPGACLPFPDDRIPASRLDPVAQAFLAKVPLPNRPGLVGNLVAVGRQRLRMDQFTLRLDQRLGSEGQLFARGTAYQVRDDQPFGTSALNEALVPGFGRIVTTRSRNLAIGHTRPFGRNWLQETRFGWLHVSGGQLSENQGDDFAGRVGVAGVTRDPRDVGYPQISLAGTFSTMGDPTTFTRRRNTSVELYENLLVERGGHAVKFGAYLFYLKFRPESPDTARGAFSFSGQFTGHPFGDFLLGYPATGQVGIGRADEDGRTTWFHWYVQDDWRARSDLTLHVGLRGEVNRHMVDVRNRLSSIDLQYPGGRFVVASDRFGRIDPGAEPLLSLIPLPWVPSQAIGWDRSLLRPGYRRFAPRLGLVWRPRDSTTTVVRGAFGIFLNQWAYSVQQAFAKNLPFFFTKHVNAAADAKVPVFRTATMLTAEAGGAVAGSIMDWDYRVEYNQTYTLDIQRLLTPRTSIELSLMASRTVGADSLTVRNVAQPGPGPIGPRRPVPQLGPIPAIRWNGWGLYHSATLRLQHRLHEAVWIAGNYTWSKSMDDASDPGPTTHEANVPQDVHNLAAERALSSYDRRHRAVINGSFAVPWFRDTRGWLAAIGANWQVSGIVTLESGAPFTVNLGIDRANVGAGPAQRPNVSGNPNLPAAERTPERWFDTSVFSMPDPYTFGNAGRNIVFGPGFASVDVVLQREFPLRRSARLEVRWEIFNLLNRPNFDIPGRIAFTPSFGRIFSAKDPRQMQVGVRLSF